MSGLFCISLRGSSSPSEGLGCYGRNAKRKLLTFRIGPSEFVACGRSGGFEEASVLPASYPAALMYQEARPLRQGARHLSPR